MAVMTNRRWTKTDAALLVGLSVLASLFSFVLIDEAPRSTPHELRRYLKTDDRRRRRRRRAAAGQQPTTSDIYPWAEHRLRPVTEAPDPSSEVPLFWHIPKSGGTTAEDIYQCLERSISNRVGSLPRFGHDGDKELLAFQPWRNNKATYVNTDTTTPGGILRAERLGLVPSGLVDVIFTSDPSFAVQHLYDEEHRGRALGLFRHPVDRLVSKFYYLQIATWERTYNPAWKKIDILLWATARNNDNNHMVKKLAGKKQNEQVDEEDLQIAMRTVQQTFIVGLMDRMEESIRRFNVFIGIDESEEKNGKCMDKFFGHGVEKKNSNSHPKLEEDNPAWAVLAEKNDLDMRLYSHILQLFDEQGVFIESYKTSMATGEARP